MTKVTPPIMTYEEIEADVATRGLKADDLLGCDDHFDRWRKRNHLPAKDPLGKHWRSSQDYHQRYERDPKGADACPPHTNLWQFLLKVGEPLAWLERPGNRTKTVPICSAMFQMPEDLTDERVIQGRRMLEADAGEPIPDDAWAQFERQARKGPAAARRCIQEIGTLLERHGEEHPDFGRMLRVTLSDC